MTAHMAVMTRAVQDAPSFVATVKAFAVYSDIPFGSARSVAAAAEVEKHARRVMSEASEVQPSIGEVMRTVMAVFNKAS